MLYVNKCCVWMVIVFYAAMNTSSCDTFECRLFSHRMLSTDNENTDNGYTTNGNTQVYINLPQSACPSGCIGCLDPNINQCDQDRNQDQCRKDSLEHKRDWVYCKGEAVENAETTAFWTVFGLLAIPFFILTNVLYCGRSSWGEFKNEITTWSLYLLSVYDFLSDLLLLILLWAVYTPAIPKDGGIDAVWPLRVISLISLISAFLIGLSVFKKSLNEWREDELMTTWISSCGNKFKIFFVFLVCGGSPVYGDLLSSKLLGGPLTPRDIHVLQSHAIMGLIAENIPQMVIASWLIVYKSQAASGASFANVGAPVLAILLSFAVTVKNIFEARNAKKVLTDEHIVEYLNSVIIPSTLTNSVRHEYELETMMNEVLEDDLEQFVNDPADKSYRVVDTCLVCCSIFNTRILRVYYRESIGDSFKIYFAINGSAEKIDFIENSIDKACENGLFQKYLRDTYSETKDLECAGVTKFEKKRNIASSPIAELGGKSYLAKRTPENSTKNFDIELDVLDDEMKEVEIVDENQQKTN